jgi:RHS repeat-associated protein
MRSTVPCLFVLIAAAARLVIPPGPAFAASTPPPAAEPPAARPFDGVRPPATHPLLAKRGDLRAAASLAAAGPPSVSPDAAPVQRTQLEPATERFTVTNTGTTPAVYTLTVSCGAAVTSCTPTRTRMSVDGLSSASVGVSYRAVSTIGTTGAVKLFAYDSATTVTDSGWVQVSVIASRPTSYASEVGTGIWTERSSCLQLPAGLMGTYECGDLRLAYALPATTVLGRSYAPTLVYSSISSNPAAIVGANTSPPAGTQPTSIGITLRWDDNTTLPQSFTASGWTSGQTRRVAVLYDAAAAPPPAAPSYIRNYTAQVTATYADGTTQLTGSGAGSFAVVDRRNSPFGNGWWLAGLEQLAPQADGSLLWVGGDGSTERYAPASAGDTVYLGDALDGPDSLVKRTGMGYERRLGGGAAVWFDAAGTHQKTCNRLGQCTVFEWTAGKLTKIWLPATGTFNTQQAYVFTYGNNGGRLSRIDAPSGAGARITTFVNSDGRIQDIYDPAQHRISYGYADATGRIVAGVNARGTMTYWRYGTGGKLSSTRVNMGTDSIVVRYGPQEAAGLSASVPIANVYTFFDGPRPDSDVQDYAYFWSDRRGMPWKVQDALGKSTQVFRADPKWQALGTRVLYPNGREVTATYDDAGRLIASTDWSVSSADGRHPTTLYEWDARWNEVTRITQPEGEATSVAFDPATGLRAWQQVGADSARRVRFDYYPLNDTHAPGRVRSVTYPRAAGQATGGVEQYDYDTRGNLAAATSPLGFRSTYLADAIGRTVSVRAPIDQAQSLFRVDTTVYDVLGQVTHTETVGPAMNGAPEQRILLDTQYDPDGRAHSITRTAQTGGTTTLAITTTWRYDAAGRKVAEVAPDSTPSVLSDNPVDSTAYDAAGNVVAVATRRMDAGGHALTIRMTYDALNRLKTRVVPDVQYTPRTEGIAAQSGMVTDTARNRPYPQYPNDGAGGYRIAGDTTYFDYDAATGLMVSARNPYAHVSRSYLSNGALAAETDSVRTWADLASGGSFATHVYAFGWQYDLNGRRTVLVHPTTLVPNLQAGQVVRDRTSYGYDPATGALSQVTDVMGNTFRFAYDAAGQPDSVFLPGGVNEIYDYDTDGRLVRHRVQNTGTSLPHHFPNPWLRDTGYGYDAQGRLLSTGNSFLSTDTLTATYSGLGYVLSSRSVSHGIGYFGDSGRSDDSQSFTYDALGNQASMSTSNTLNRYLGMIRESSTSYMGYETGTGRLLKTYQTFLTETNQYDAAGNLVFASGDGIKSATLNDRALFYSADGQLRAADFRKRGNVMSEAPQNFTSVFEEYRYDPLGRRVAVWTRRWCELPDPNGGASLAECRLSTLRRTIWDGSAELGEIQMPGAPGDAMAENDTAQVPFIAWNSTRDGNFYDQNPYFGRVVYTYGLAVDQPLSIVRIGLADAGWDSIAGHQATVTRWPAFAFMPLWTHKGSPDLATFADGSAVTCVGSGSAERCIPIRFPLQWFAYARSGLRPVAWWGTLTEDKQDRSGLSYRRSRYYDPDNGRFTQEDPAGLAGGLNLYGFANGDPVNYDDPYGLLGCPNNLSAVRSFLCELIDATLTTGGGVLGFTLGTGLGIGETVGTGGPGVVLAPATVAASAGTLAVGGHLMAERVNNALFSENSAAAGQSGNRDDGGLSQWARKNGWNAQSQTTQNLFNNRGMKVTDFIGRFRKASIRQALGNEYMDKTVDEALSEGGSTVRKLLGDGRFVK